MKAFGLARIGRDVEVRMTPQGEPVAGLSLAFSRTVKGEKLTQWVDAALWGKRAESLAPYLLKGGQIAVTLDDVHIETYGEGKTKLAARVLDIELAGSKAAEDAPAKAKPAAKAEKSDDDIPF